MPPTSPITAPGSAPYVARGPLDLIALVPVVLGFHPEDSVVLLTFGPPGGWPQARVDLPPTATEQAETAESLVGAARRNRVRMAAVVIFSDDEQASRAMGRLLSTGLHGIGCDVIDILRVEAQEHRGRWFSVVEDDPVGTAYDLLTHPFTAQHVFAGHVVHRDRAQLADTLVGTDEDDAAAVTLAATRHCDYVESSLATDEAGLLRAEALWLRRRVRQRIRTGRPIGAGDAGRMLAMVALTSVRDVAWAEINRRVAPRDLQAHVDLWRDLVRRAPQPLLPGAAALLAFAAWQFGDGALAWCAVDRALEADPDHVLAQLVAGMLLGAVSPEVWEPIGDDDLPALRGGG